MGSSNQTTCKATYGASALCANLVCMQINQRDLNTEVAWWWIRRLSNRNEPTVRQ